MRAVRAFTLVEMLVVIAIIALLSGIVLAVLPAVRKRSYEAVCLSHLRQLGQAFAMYKQDWGGIEAEKGRYCEPWQLGLPPRVFIPLSNGDCDTPIGTVDLWQCPASDLEGRCGFKYSGGFQRCFRPPEQDPLETCRLWERSGVPTGAGSMAVIGRQPLHRGSSFTSGALPRHPAQFEL